MKVIIAGGREFSDYEFLRSTCDRILQNVVVSEIVSGSCDRGVLTFTALDGRKVNGADGLGERYALENGIKVAPFPANWNKYGRSAAPIRNRQMAEYADALIAFHDGKSRGTKDMIEKATELGLKIRVIRYL